MAVFYRDMGVPRPIVIDGFNVGIEHGRAEKIFSCKGIWLAVNHIFGLSDKCFILLVYPKGDKPAGYKLRVTDAHLIDELKKRFPPTRFQVFYSPMRYAESESGRAKITGPTDERIVVEIAHMIGGIVVSNWYYGTCDDKGWSETLENRILTFTFCRDIFHLVVDPLGRRGPELLDINAFPNPDSAPENFFKTPATLSVSDYMAKCRALGAPSYLEAEQEKLFGVLANSGHCVYDPAEPHGNRISPDLGYGNGQRSNASLLMRPMTGAGLNYLSNMLSAAEQAGLVVVSHSDDSGVSEVNRSLSQPLSDIDGLIDDRFSPDRLANDESGEDEPAPIPIDSAQVILPRESFAQVDDELSQLMQTSFDQQLLDDMASLFPGHTSRLSTFMATNPNVTDVLDILERVFYAGNH